MAIPVPTCGTTGNCSPLRAKLNRDTPVQATGPCRIPPFKHPFHITWCMNIHVFRVLRTPRVLTRARDAGRCEKYYVRVSDAKMAVGATELGPKSRNVRVTVATLSVGTPTSCSCKSVEALETDFWSVRKAKWSCSRSKGAGLGFKTVLVPVPQWCRLSASMRSKKTAVASKERLYHFFSAYTPQTDRSDRGRDSFDACLLRRPQRYRPTFPS